MNIPEEIQKLQELHSKGALTDEEFSKAKSAVIAGQSTPVVSPTPAPAEPPRRWKLPWGLMILSTILLVAFFTNPDRASLEKTWRENREKNRAKAGMLEKLAEDALVDVSFERRNYYLFSIGTAKVRVRLGGPEQEVEILGAFGRWWLELPNSPLDETKKK